MGRDNKNTAIYVAFDEYDQSEVTVPERSLLRAVLLNAVADLRRPGDFNRKALEYFLSREEDYVFSFHSVCGYLNIDPRQILILVGLNQGRPSTLLESALGDSFDVEDVQEESVESAVRANVK